MAAGVVVLASAVLVDDAAFGAAKTRRAERIAGKRGQAAEHAVVDFAEVMAQEARTPALIPVPTIPQPEVETPVDVPLDDEELAALPRPEPEPSVQLPAGPSPLSPLPADSFSALPDAAPLINVIPPDTHGAAGPSHLLTMLNSEVRVQDKTGGTLSTVSLNGFWSSVAGGSGTFDPRVVYDPYANRWIVAACDDGQLTTSSLLVGVSQTSNPQGLWNLYRIDDIPSNTLWYDFPSVGFTKDWIVVQTNVFTIPGAFADSYVHAFNKANLYAGGAGTYMLFKLGTGLGATQSPAVTYDNTLATAFLVNNWNSGAGALRIHTITGAVGSEIFTASSFVVAPTGWNGGGPGGPDAPQASLSDVIDTGDARMQKVVFRNGSLWAAQTIFLPATGPSRSSVQWWKFLPSGAIQQRGLIDDPSGSLFYAYPSIAVNANDDALVGYSRFSLTQFASANYSFRTGNDPADTLQSDFLFKAGQGAYEKYFGGPDNRWGDYSNASVDPVNDRDLWTIQEYAGTPVPPTPNSGRWGTWWARVASTPTLSIGDTTVTEGNSGTVTATFTVSLSRAVLQTVQVDFATADGTALTGDNDYVAASGNVTFSPGQTTLPVNVTVQGDTKFEPNETFTVTLTNPVNADLLDDQGVGTIQNDDSIPLISVNDVSVPEGNSGTSPAAFTVSLSNPSSQTVSATYTTPGVSATPTVDYQTATGTVTFVPGDVSETVTVDVNGDTTPEPDETFQLLLSGNVNANFADNTGLGTILNDDAPGSGVAFFTVTAKPGQNRLEWVNPSSAPFFGTVIRYNVSTPTMSDCTYPTAATGAGSGTGGFGPFVGPGLGGRDAVSHTGLPDDTKVCYTAFVQGDAGGTTFSPGVTNQGRPPAAGPVKWAFSMGSIFSMIPPGTGVGVVHAVAQDGSLHAMVKGSVAEGGTWPTTPLFPLVWMPQKMSGPSQGRPSGIATSTTLSTRTIFLTSQDGHVYAFNAETGALAWISSALAPSASLQAHPSGVFTIFGGTRDYLFVGSHDVTGSRFYALNVSNGSTAWTFDGVSAGFGKIGAISGQAAVDQVAKRVYFASRAFGAFPDDKTVWCVDLETGAGRWAQPFGDIDTGVSFTGTRLLVGTNTPSPAVKNIDTVSPNEGVQVWSFPISPALEGPAKGYVAVDRVSGSIFFATATKLWALNPDMTPKWAPTGDRLLVNASTPVFAPQDLYVYAGGGDGKLHRFFVATGAEDTTAPFPIRLGDGTGAAGSPTYDLAANYMYVGTDDGLVYAVQLP